MGDKVLDRVQKLIALSTSPEVEEARTSAQLACQLILEHRLIVVRHERSRPITDDDDDTPPSSHDVAPRRPARPPPRPPPRSAPRPSHPLRIVVMCDSVCAVCGKEVRLAEEAWLRGKDVFHLECLK